MKILIDGQVVYSDEESRKHNRLRINQNEEDGKISFIGDNGNKATPQQLVNVLMGYYLETIIEYQCETDEKKKAELKDRLEFQSRIFTPLVNHSWVD